MNIRVNCVYYTGVSGIKNLLWSIDRKPISCYFENATDGGAIIIRKL